MSRPTIWIVSELYYPEESATGHYMTGIAEWLAKDYPVRVLCARRGHKSAKARTLEKRNGVIIHRLNTLQLTKDMLILRLLNILTINFSFFRAGLGEIGRGDIVIVVTNPPSLPFVTIAACRIKKAKCVIRVDDIYPDVLAAAGVLNSHSQLYKLISKLSLGLLIRAEMIVALGRDMKDLLAGRLRGYETKLRIITNWADEQTVRPDPEKGNKLLENLGLKGKFVIQCAGNIGRVQGIEQVFEAALLLREKDDIHFLFIGAGAKTAWLGNRIKELGLRNITILYNRPRAEQIEFLNACDVALSALTLGMLGVSVPSRMYNVFAAGKPIIAAVESTSEMALTIKEEMLGWVVNPGDVPALVAAILVAQSLGDELIEIGKRARVVAETRFSTNRILASYSRLVNELQIR